MPKNWEEARAWLEGTGDAPLVVTCPRCERSGVVSSDGRGEYTIEWRDDRNGWKWHDAGVTLGELQSPQFGCGHDRRAGADGGFVGGAPLATRAPGR